MGEAHGAMRSAATTAPAGAGGLARARRGIRGRGAVAGGGCRPAVYRRASELALSGLVRNDAEGVWVEVEGAPEALDRFARRLEAEVPALGRIDALEVVELPPGGAAGFEVLASAAGAA